MKYYVGGLYFDSEDSLAHHGIKGQKWGVRRFQNEDGSLTEAGKKRHDNFMENAHNSYHDKYLTGDPELAKSVGDTTKKVKSDLVNIRDKNVEKVGYKEKLNREDKANEERRKHTLLELVKPNNKYSREFKEAQKERQKAVNEFFNSSSIEMSLYIEKLPKKNRKAAYAFAYKALGLDW